MRIRSNYGTVDAYLVNHISESDQAIYNGTLCTVTRATVALLELFIMRKIGKPELSKIASDFVDQDRHNLSAKMLQAPLTAYDLAA